MNTSVFHDTTNHHAQRLLVPPSHPSISVSSHPRPSATRSCAPPKLPMRLGQLPVGETLVAIIPQKQVLPARRAVISPSTVSKRNPLGQLNPPSANAALGIKAASNDRQLNVPEITLPVADTPSTAPRVVVVNPTPHPTPPATPTLPTTTLNNISPPQTQSTLLPLVPTAAPTTVVATSSRHPSGPASSTPPPVPAPANTTEDKGTKAIGDDTHGTLRPSDKRFFLKQSPDQLSPEREEPSSPSLGPGEEEADTPKSDMVSIEPGSYVSATSSRGVTAGRQHGQMSAAQVTGHASTKRARKGGGVVVAAAKRPTLNRHNSTARAAALQRRNSEREKLPRVATKTAIDVGSNSSTGSRDKEKNSKMANLAAQAQHLYNVSQGKAPPAATTTNKTHKRFSQANGRLPTMQPMAPVKPPARAPSMPAVHAHAQPLARVPSAPSVPRPPSMPAVHEVAMNPALATAAVNNAQRRAVLVASTSSDCETNSDTELEDDDEWASEELSTHDLPSTRANGGRAQQQRSGQTDADRRRVDKNAAGLEQAALEAQRQRGLFNKLPKRSYSNLGQRTQSGLLSQLMNPDPSMFYNRQTASSQDITQYSAVHGHPQHSRVVSQPQLQQQPQQQRQRQQPPQQSFVPPLALKTRSSQIAVALAPQLSVVASQGVVSQVKPGTSGGYRPKGKPEGAELDDSDSEGEATDNAYKPSAGALERLKQMADKRDLGRNTTTSPKTNGRQAPIAPPVVRTSLPDVSRPVPTALAIPPGHPWNLPAPPPPTSPRTTRRQMMSTELSESLRRNLLWERQIGHPPRRQYSTSVLGNQPRPLAPTAPLEPEPNAAQRSREERLRRQRQQEAEQQQQQPHRTTEQQLMEQRRAAALARNRSWADDYHTSGW
jgi:hypothetical protein